MIQNGIEFSINTNDTYTIVNKKISIDSPLKINAGKVTPVINAVAIDWNNTKINDNLYINTTGELISWIKDEFANITNIINNIETGGTSGSDNNGLTLEQIESINYLVDFVHQIKNNSSSHVISGDGYYFYVGPDRPTSNTTISPAEGVVVGQQGWYLIGDSLDNINISHPALDASDPSNAIILVPTYDHTVDFYIAIPQELNMYDAFGNNMNGDFAYMGTTVISGHTYKIFMGNGDEFMTNIY